MNQSENRWITFFLSRIHHDLDRIMMLLEDDKRKREKQEVKISCNSEKERRITN